MGHRKDKHGRVNWDPPQVLAFSEICGKCGRKAANMQDHNALFHPEYRDEEPPSRPERKPDPEQTRLE